MRQITLSFTLRKHTLLSSNLVPRTLKIASYSFEISKFSGVFLGQNLILHLPSGKLTFSYAVLFFFTAGSKLLPSDKSVDLVPILKDSEKIHY